MVEIAGDQVFLSRTYFLWQTPGKCPTMKGGFTRHAGSAALSMAHELREKNKSVPVAVIHTTDTGEVWSEALEMYLSVNCPVKTAEIEAELRSEGIL